MKLDMIVELHSKGNPITSTARATHIGEDFLAIFFTKI